MLQSNVLDHLHAHQVSVHSLSVWVCVSMCVPLTSSSSSNIYTLPFSSLLDSSFLLSLFLYTASAVLRTASPLFASSSSPSLSTSNFDPLFVLSFLSSCLDHTAPLSDELRCKLLRVLFVALSFLLYLLASAFSRVSSDSRQSLPSHLMQKDASMTLSYLPVFHAFKCHLSTFIPLPVSLSLSLPFSG